MRAARVLVLEVPLEERVKYLTEGYDFPKDRLRQSLATSQPFRGELLNRGKNGLELLSILVTNNLIGEASLVGRCGGFDGESQHRVGDVDAVQDDGMARVAERVTRGGALQAGDRNDVAR